MKNVSLKARTIADIDGQVDKVLRGLGNPEPPADLRLVRDLLKLDRGYYSGCLQSPIEEMEACLDDGLGLDGVTKGVDLDLDGLMRMDTKTQMEALKIGVDAGIIAPNEGRKQVNLPPLDGGDTVYMQQQDFPLDQVRQNKIVQPSPAPAPVPEPADVSDEDKSLILEAKSIIATQKAIEAMRKAAQPEAVHV